MHVIPLFCNRSKKHACTIRKKHEYSPVLDKILKYIALVIFIDNVEDVECRAFGACHPHRAVFATCLSFAPENCVASTRRARIRKYRTLAARRTQSIHPAVISPKRNELAPLNADAKIFFILKIVFRPHHTAPFSPASDSESCDDKTQSISVWIIFSHPIRHANRYLSLICHLCEIFQQTNIANLNISCFNFNTKYLLSI